MSASSAVTSVATLWKRWPTAALSPSLEPVLRDKLGPRFKAGVVLHAGADTLPFGDRLAAVPVGGLWS